jgi:hypothetical protein
MKSKNWIVRLDMKEASFIVKAKTVEEAARMGINKAARLVSKGTATHQQPAILTIDGSAPDFSIPAKVTVHKD